MDILSLLIQLASGAAGGSVAGNLMKNVSLGSLGNIITGAVGGGLGANILNSAIGVTQATAAAGLDPGTIISQIAGGGVGGGALTILAGILRSMFAK